MELLLRFVIVFCSCLILTVKANPFPCDYNYFADVEGWIKFHEEGTTWSQASRICSLEGAQLAAPTTVAMRDAMLSIMLLMNNVIVPKIHTATLPPANEVSANVEALALTFNGDMRRVSQYESLPYMCYRKDAKFIQLTECGTFDKEYTLDPRTHHCYKFHRNRNSWFEASLTCMIEGGTLAVINTETEAQVIRDIFEKNPAEVIPGEEWRDSAFIGFWARGNREWMTVLGPNLNISGYEEWSEGEPNNARGDEYCGSVGRNGKLFDDPCTRYLPFICERRTNSNCGKPKQIAKASRIPTVSPVETADAIRKLIDGRVKRSIWYGMVKRVQSQMHLSSGPRS